MSLDKGKSFYWISWYQPTDDYRPLTYPPNEGVLGWWCSGETDNAYTLCAWVQAANEVEAKNIIKLDWPEAERWRFCEKKDSIEPSDRFPLEEWMEERFASASK